MTDFVSEGGKNVIQSYKTMSGKYLNNVTNNQIADGLDSFYEDFRNHSIVVSKGVWIVLNMISGKPDAEIQKMIETFRKNAK